MSSQRCLYALMCAERDRHEEIVRDLVTPVARAVRASPELDSLFFARFDVPEWQVRFRVLGRPDWVGGPVKELIQESLEPLRRRGAVGRAEFAAYQREYERYGGEEGMRLAEQIFLHDTLACLDLMEAERQGLCARTRREFSLALTHRFLDLMRFDTRQRLAFYAHGYRWAIEMRSWQAEELRILDARYAELRSGLEALIFGDDGTDPVALWGGEAAAGIAARCLEAWRPVTERILEGHAKGRIRQDLVYLAWSYTHMQCNRLGIDPAPEAILRYFMHRLLKEKAGAAA